MDVAPRDRLKNPTNLVANLYRAGRHLRRLAHGGGGWCCRRVSRFVDRTGAAQHVTQGLLGCLAGNGPYHGCDPLLDHGGLNLQPHVGAGGAA